MDINPPSSRKRLMKAKLIFNPNAGAARDIPVEILDVIREMQAWNLIPETYLVEPDCDLHGMIRNALTQGIRLFVVCGGDGTITAVASALAGTPAALGIIPIGSQNNTALSLGIPLDLPASIAVLRNGRRIKIDLGMAVCGKTATPFLEVCSVGLVSTLFPSADDIQHGNIARVADFLTALVGTPPAEIHLLIDGKQEVNHFGHVVLVSNMTYTGPHFQVGAPDAYQDGLLDVLSLADLSKLELLGFLLQGVGSGSFIDPRIQHYHVRKIEIDTQPAMPIMVDGTSIGIGQVSLTIRRHCLTVIVPQPAPIPESASGINLEQ